MFKKKVLRYISVAMSAFIALSLFLAFPSSVIETDAAGYTDATVKKMEVSIAKIEEQIKAKKAELAKISGEKAQADKESNLIYEEILLKEQKITETENLITELTNQIEAKSIEIEEKKADVDEQTARFKERVRLAYEEGNTSYIEIILGSGDMSEFLSRLEYINSMIEYDNRLMKDYKTQKSELEDERKQLESAKELQEKYRSDCENERSELKEKKKELDAVCAELQSQYAEEYAAYEEARKAEDQLNAELEAYIKEQQEKNKKAFVGGDFIWPLDDRYNYISSGFGWRTYYLYGRLRKDNHRGIDIIGLPHLPLNSNIYASNSGTVIKSELHYSYGNYIIIDHGGGITTLYAHANSRLVNVGDTVERGQVIALAGTTGDSSGVHLHFEYRVNGSPVNPVSVLNVP